MKNIILITNIVTYLILFFVVFIKLTDKNKNTLCEKLSLFFLIIWSLFLSVYLTELYFFKNNRPLNYLLNFYEIITKLLVISYFITKIKDDKMFKNK